MRTTGSMSFRVEAVKTSNVLRGFRGQLLEGEGAFFDRVAQPARYLDDVLAGDAAQDAVGQRVGAENPADHGEHIRGTAFAHQRVGRHEERLVGSGGAGLLLG